MKLLRQLWRNARRGNHVWSWHTRYSCNLYHSSCTGTNYFSVTQSQLASQIMRHTELTRNHMTPVIQLHLVTPNCELWHIKGDNSPFPDPFWAFYWPGGQAVTRYILDNSDLVHGKSVLDVGCGCGASSIAAAQCGAKTVLANDIDPVAIAAVKLNANYNGCSIATNSQNLIGSDCHQWDVLILGDMFYDSEFADHISDWLKHQVRNDTLILIGDPGRITFLNHPLKSQLTKLVEYELPEDCKMENSGLTCAAVWNLTGGLNGS